MFEATQFMFLKKLIYSNVCRNSHIKGIFCIINVTKLNMYKENT